MLIHTLIIISTFTSVIQQNTECKFKFKFQNPDTRMKFPEKYIEKHKHTKNVSAMNKPVS